MTATAIFLAYNELAYSVTFEYSGDYKNKELNQIVSTVIQMVRKKRVFCHQ